mmetsp:Transcript_28890/g.59616  ORF Transcript_28890/g.59616 Transcript_28890/m.59616 type:complete len:258 (-) Transcript_28890:1392-2165(-)
MSNIQGFPAFVLLLVQFLAEALQQGPDGIVLLGQRLLSLRIFSRWQRHDIDPLATGLRQNVCECCTLKACLGRSKFCERHLTLALGVDDVLVHVFTVLHDANAVHQIVLPVGHIFIGDGPELPVAAQGLPNATTMTFTFQEVASVGAPMRLMHGILLEQLSTFEVLYAKAIRNTALPLAMVEEVLNVLVFRVLFLVRLSFAHAFHELRIVGSSSRVHGTPGAQFAILAEDSVEELARAGSILCSAIKAHPSIFLVLL